MEKLETENQYKYWSVPLILTFDKNYSDIESIVSLKEFINAWLIIAFQNFREHLFITRIWIKEFVFVRIYLYSEMIVTV